MLDALLLDATVGHRARSIVEGVVDAFTDRGQAIQRVFLEEEWGPHLDQIGTVLLATSQPPGHHHERLLEYLHARRGQLERHRPILLCVGPDADSIQASEDAAIRFTKRLLDHAGFEPEETWIFAGTPAMMPPEVDRTPDEPSRAAWRAQT